MVKRNKIMSAIMAVSLFGGSLAGCSPSPGGGNQEAQCRIASTIERRTHTQNHDGVIGGKTPEENTQFEQEIERLTGIKVTMNKPVADYDQKGAGAIASGEKFDLRRSAKKMSTFVEQGILTPLTEQVNGSKVLSDQMSFPRMSGNKLRRRMARSLACSPSTREERCRSFARTGWTS